MVCTDSDHAGCLKTRKSTSCAMTFHGKHLIRSTATTQGVIALSSGESEFYAAVKGASSGLGMVNMCLDMGMTIEKPVKLLVDATAGIGIASRRGVGRIRHIHTPSLWLQRSVHNRRVAMDKIPGKINPADVGTKFVNGESIRQMWDLCGFVLIAGTSAKALKAAIGRGKASTTSTAAGDEGSLSWLDLASLGHDQGYNLRQRRRRRRRLGPSVGKSVGPVSRSLGPRSTTSGAAAVCKTVGRCRPTGAAIQGSTGYVGHVCGPTWQHAHGDVTSINTVDIISGGVQNCTFLFRHCSTTAHFHSEAVCEQITHLLSMVAEPNRGLLL